MKELLDLKDKAQLRNFISSIIRNEVSENINLDFKKEFGFSHLKDASDIQKQKLLKHIVAFANLEGGYILIGIEEGEGSKKGVAKNVHGVEIEQQFDEFVNGIIDLVKYKTEPSIHGLEIENIDIEKDDSIKIVVIISIRQSYLRPHRIKEGKLKDFYIRSSRSSQPMDYNELKRQFILTETLGERIRSFRKERIESIYNNTDVPINTSNNPLITLHFVPLDSFNINELYDLITFKRDYKYGLPGIHRRHIDTTFNIDGLLAVSPNEHCYTQLYRNGIIETVDSQKRLESDSQELILSVVSICKHMPYFFEILYRLNINSPIVILLSLLRVNGLMIGRPSSSSNTITKDIILIPEFLFDDYDSLRYYIGFDEDTVFQACVRQMKPIFDIVWQSAHWERCHLYDEEGNIQL